MSRAMASLPDRRAIFGNNSCLKQSKVDKGSAHTGAGNETTFTVRALAMSKGIGTKGYPLGHR